MRFPGTSTSNLRLWSAVPWGICHASAYKKIKELYKKKKRIPREKSTGIQFILSKKLQMYS